MSKKKQMNQIIVTKKNKIVTFVIMNFYTYIKFEIFGFFP